MDLITAPKDNSAGASSESLPPIGRDSSGIALFMVLAAVSVLAILVTEFTYIAQVGQMIAYGGLDQTKAHYIAKSGLKLSLLRLKAYQQVKNLTASLGGGAGAAVPKSLINKIWSFPFFYPIPTNIPGMSSTDKQMIEKFQKDSGLDGSFSALIESESSKYNLNLLLPGYAASPSPGPSTTPSGTPSGTPGGGEDSTSTTTPNPNASFSPQAARDSLQTYLANILAQKSEADPDFGSLYRDFRLDDFVDNIASWADRGYERKTSSSLDKVIMKRAPFYSVSELHMLPTIDDDLYNLFAPSLTVNAAGGININTMQDTTVHALVPQMTPDEVKEFFKFRDSEDQDNSFKSPDDFYKYLDSSVGAFKGRQQALTDFKKDLADRGINLVTDESQFKITVQAKVNNATRTIEAWVTLESSSGTGGSTSQTGANPSGAPVVPGGPGGTTTPPPDSGLKITFMKIL